MLEHRIAVSGLTGAGKTTFLISLLDHWRQHAPSRFSIGSNGKVEIRFKWADDASRRQFEHHKARLQDRQWPEKTLCNESYRVAVRVEGARRPWDPRRAWSSWKRVTLIDIPGERFADANMLRFRRYADWCDETIHRLASKAAGDAKRSAEEFLKVYATVAAADGALADTSQTLGTAYQRMLADFIRHDDPFISPSSLLINDRGQFIPDDIRRNPDGERLYQWLSEEADCGVRAEPVYPLPPWMRPTEEGRKIAANYEKYCAAVVSPALRPLAGCHDLLVLVDVAGILELGPQWKNALADAATSIISAVSPKSGTWRAIRKIGRATTFGIVSDCVTRVWLIAAQRDRIHQSQYGRLQRLIESLMREVTRDAAVDGIVRRAATTVCAVDCMARNQELQQYNRRNAEGALESVETSPQELPEEFPDDWPPGHYAFPAPELVIPSNRGNPPRQQGLDRLTAALLGVC